MKKIPTVLVRDENNRRYVTDEVTPGCEWVLAGEGVPTRKMDGTCVMFDGGKWWARREVRVDRRAPHGFQMVEFDAVTGKEFGWEPIEQSSFAKFHAEALEKLTNSTPGTYELCGPKINGNPEGFSGHVLLPHAGLAILDSDRSIEGIKAQVRGMGKRGYEGIVWHHPDGRMAKLKARDLRTSSDTARTDAARG